MRSVRLFGDCSDAEIDALDGLATEVSVPAGRELLHEGAMGLQFAVVLEGIASVLRDGDEIARLAPGSFFGERGLLEGSPRSASVTAVTPMRLLVFDVAQFDALVREIPSVRERIEHENVLRAPPVNSSFRDVPASRTASGSAAT